MEIEIIKTSNPKQKPDPKSLNFGEIFTDHMFIMNYDEGKGWHSPRITPYEPLPLDPAAAVLHYAQELFEGLKTYKGSDNSINLFRPDMNAKRANNTATRICVPHIDEKIFVDAIKALVEIDKDWIPEADGTSLYIRPFIIATEPFLGVRPSKSYLFIVILSPVGSYYEEGLAPTKIFVEDVYARSGKGGTGEAKVGGNYASSLASQVKAHELGFSQVMWLDSKEKVFVEEIGTSNAFFVIDDTVYTPNLTGTILPGITRDSIITLLKDFGIKIVEGPISINDVFDAHAKGNLKEVFASGTATVISPVGTLKWKEKEIVINDNQIGGITQKLYDTLTGIQSGKVKDTHNWVEVLK